MIGHCACGRAGVRIRKGLCPACYERARYRANHFDPALLAPCVLCDERGPVNALGTPIRHDGESWGIGGDVCARCAGSLAAEARGGYGYRWRRHAARRGLTVRPVILRSV